MAEWNGRDVEAGAHRSLLNTETAITNMVRRYDGTWCGDQKIVGLLLLIVCLSACSPSDQAPPVQPIALPDISSAADPVQKQIRDHYQQLQAAIDRKASPKELATAFGEMGKLFMAAEYYEAAEACLRNAQQLDSADMRWPYLLGHVFRYRSDPARAASFFEQGLAHSPQHVPSLVWLAEMNMAQNRADAAEEPLKKAQALDAASGAVLYGLGRVALAKQDYMESVRYLEQALAISPQATRLHYPLALAYRGLGNRAKAEEHLRLRGEVELPPVDPLLGEVSGLLQNAAAYEARASQALGARQWSEAEANLRKAIALAPGNAFSRLNLGTALYMQGDTDRALEQYREAVRLSPTLARAHFAIGVLMEGRGQESEAIKAFKAAIASDPGYAEPRFSLANALRRNGRVQESLSQYAEVLRLDPSVSQASFGYAMGLVRLGRYQEARSRLEAAMKAFPDQPGFPHALARLLAAAPDDRVRDGARAMAIMNELVKAQQTLAMAETMAMALAESGHFDEAVKWQREAIRAATESKRDDLAGKLSVNLQLYQNGQPCRTPWAPDDPVHHPVSEQ
jgi:tetratricopeptide (TPR) repeat protein